MRIAFCQDDHTNIETALEQAKQASAEVLVFGELWLNKPDGIESDHPLIGKIAQASGAAGIPMIFGYFERCKTGTYSAAQFVDAQGHSISNCRSTHPRSGNLTANNWMTLVEVEDESIGILLDQDHLLPEPARALALKGATTLLILSRDSGQNAELERAILTTRAVENGVFVLCMSGERVIGVSPAGALIEPSSSSETMTVLDIEAERPGMPSRRPELYQQLVIVDA